MEYFTRDGAFWLPARPDRPVPGTLTFDPEGITLQLRGSLHEYDWPAAGEVHRYSPSRGLTTVAVVHGRLYEGGLLTLLGATGANLAGPFEAVEVWRVEFALTGGLVTDGLFDEAYFGFDALTPWTRPPGFATEGDAPTIVNADMSRVTLIESATGTGTQVRLVAGVEGSWEPSRVHLDQWCQWETSGDVRSINEILVDWVRPFQDPLILSLGRPVRLTSLSVRKGADERNASLAVSFNAVQPKPRNPPTQAEIDNHDAPTLLTRGESPISVEKLVASWSDTRERLRDAVTLLCGPYYAPFIYSEHRYASTFQAAEALALKLYSTTEKSREDHRRRVDAVNSALSAAGLNEETVTWATNVLRGRNDKPLPALMEELARSTGEVGKRIMGVVPNFGQEVAYARVAVSHGGAHETDPSRRFWLGDALSWIVRVRLLAETGLPLDELVSRTVQKPRFTRVIDELSAV